MVSKELNNEIQELLHKMRQTELADSEWDRLRVLGSEDPFLMDAMEGLRLMPPNERADRIRSIEASLDELLGKRRKKKTIVWQLRRVAAALILILGFWVVWQAFPDGQSKLALHNKLVVSHEQQDQLESKEPQDLQESKEPQDLQEPKEPQDLKQPKEPQGQQESLNKVDPIEEASGVQRYLSTDADVIKSNEAAPTAELIHDKEVNSDMIAADIAESDYQKISTETANIEDPVRELDPDISSVQYQAKTRSATQPAPLKAEQNPVGLATPLAQRSAHSGTAKTQDADIRSIVYSNAEMDTLPTKKNQAPDHISYALAIPQMGWKSYYKYIRKNIVTPKAANDASVSGTVMLEFDLKQDGSAHNFRIVQSLGYGCDEEAIRLVREGPKWDVKNAQVEIGGLSVDF